MHARAGKTPAPTPAARVQLHAGGREPPSHNSRICSPRPSIAPPPIPSARPQICRRCLLILAAASFSSSPSPSLFVGCRRREITQGKEQSLIRRRINESLPVSPDPARLRPIWARSMSSAGEWIPRRQEALRIWIPLRRGTLVGGGRASGDLDLVAAVVASSRNGSSNQIRRAHTSFKEWQQQPDPFSLLNFIS